MDAETRHKLKTNEFGEALERLMTFNDPRLKYWLGAIIVVALLVAGYRLWSWNQRNALAGAWRDLSQLDADSAEREVIPELQTLIANNSDPQLLASARLRLGHALVRKYNKDGGDEALLREAENALRQVEAETDTPAAIAASALLLQGTVYETLNQWDEARQAYEKLKEPRFDGVPARAIALQRIDTLSELATRIQFLPGSAPPPPETSAGPQSAPATQPSPASATQPTGTPAPATQPASEPPQP
jgi:predicted negative regulator of RcsB-dependent stress response